MSEPTFVGPEAAAARIEELQKWSNTEFIRDIAASTESLRLVYPAEEVPITASDLARYLFRADREGAVLPPAPPGYKRADVKWRQITSVQVFTDALDAPNPYLYDCIAEILSSGHWKAVLLIEGFGTATPVDGD